MFTICDSEFPLYHNATPCSGALYFGKHDLAHEHCNKIILRKDFKPVWIHQKGIPNFWIYSLPAPIKVTKTCKIKGITNSIDIDLEGTEILYEEENCQIFSEDFLLLSTASGQTNFTLTRGQVVVPKLPELLTPEEVKVVVDHHSEAHGTLRALDTIVGRSLTVRRQHEISLRELLEYVQKDQHNRRYNWIIVGIILILILIISYLTSKNWLRPLLEFASRFPWRRPKQLPAQPQPKRRTRNLSEIYEERTSDNNDAAIALINNPISHTTTASDQMHYNPPEEPSNRDLPGVVPVTPSMSMQFSQPGKFQM
jgi:hypothetical protein